VATYDRADARAGTGQLGLEGALLRAALLAGYGREAAPLARRLAAVAEAGSSRSCLDAGAQVQFTVDAPGPAALRVGLRIGAGFDKALDGLLPAAAEDHLHRVLELLPGSSHESLGTWLFWSEGRQSIYVDVRDPSPEDACARIRAVLRPREREAFDRLRVTMAGARPWVLRLESSGGTLARAHVHWLFDRHASPGTLANAVAPDAWPRVVSALGHLLKRPGQSGRWVVATPLDDASEPALRIGNTGWALVPEDDQKQRAVGALMAAHGGARDYAEALWSLCRGTAEPEWRVGRACELKVTANRIRARLFMVPQLH
jgi:hypothetical protein